MTSTTTGAEVAMASAALKTHYTPQDYLSLERQADSKSEYLDGIIVAMAGASREHNLIAGNLAGEVRAQLKNRSCESYTSDMRVLVSRTGLYTYPDVTVVCGKPELEDDTLLNPQVIFEVLSPSTEAYDRGQKFHHYQTIPSFREYVLVSQHEVHIDHFVKQPDGTWLLRSLGKGQSIELSSVGCSLRVDEVYLKVFALPG
jgi:Uma2 family endonuclease